jgi:hypothetical protein
LNSKKILALIAGGLTGLAVSSANAQPFVINISGATLLENFVRAQSSTNDYIDVDGDGVAGILGSVSLDQLAPGVIDPFANGQRWCVQYRVVGSVNGFVELMRYGKEFITTDAGRPEMTAAAASLAYYNGVRYINAGVPDPIANTGNLGAYPVTSDTVTLSALRNPNDVNSGGGIRIDIAPVDVPSAWAVNTDGSPSPFATPGAAGYGTYNRPSVNNLGGNDGFAGIPSNLPELENNANLFSPNVTPDSNTIFDTSLSYAPIALVTSLGTGVSQMLMTDVQHLFVTGRVSSGENFMAVTRDVGSGTRNAFMNTIGIDPSWGGGDNIGGRPELPSTSVNNDFLGAEWVPTNKGGNSNVERTVRQHRLAIGYAGAERGVTGSGTGSWLTQGALECVAVRHNAGAYADDGIFYRPDIDSVVDGKYNIGGPAVLASIGDPKNQNEVGGVSGNLNPRLRNPHAAAYLNNVRISIRDFVSTPGGDPNNDFMPGELAATQFVLPESLVRVHNFFTPTQMDVNISFNVALNTYTRANNRLSNPLFDSFNTSTAGRVPTRVSGAGITYTDGVVNGANYITQSGAILSYGGTLTQRNKIAFDFNGDGVRSPADVAGAIAAWRQRQPAGPVWNAPDGVYGAGSGTQACIEILGDNNGDGSYTAADLRYYADGLHLVAGRLDRKAGFTAVDNAFGGNFFGTTKSTGTAHNPGDSRADIASASGNVTPGFAPVGSDGTIDINDLLYIRAQFINNPFVADNDADWADLSEAAGFDLSADLTGDLKVNTDDLAEFYSILGTCPVDFNFDGFVDFFDYDDFVAAFEAGSTLTDYNNDGFIDFFDYDDFVAAFEAGC